MQIFLRMRKRFKKFVNNMNSNKKETNNETNKETKVEDKSKVENSEQTAENEQDVPVENNDESCNCNAEETDAETTAETEVSEAEKKLLEAETKIAETNDKYVRLAAEFDNYRRRVAKEKLELIATASEDVIKGILPVLDDCYRALKVLKESDAPVSAIEGTELILNKLTAFLKVKGLTMIEAKGKEFNTDDMEAVTQFPVEDKEQKGKVIDVVQDGYMLNGKVIRFAKVVVGA